MPYIFSGDEYDTWQEAVKAALDTIEETPEAEATSDKVTVKLSVTKQYPAPPKGTNRFQVRNVAIADTTGDPSEGSWHFTLQDAVEAAQELGFHRALIGAFEISDPCGCSEPNCFTTDQVKELGTLDPEVEGDTW